MGGVQILSILNYGFMALLCLVCLAPLWHVLMSSVSNPRLLMQTKGLLWLPAGDMTLDGYKIVMKNRGIISGCINTLIYVVAFVAIGTALCTVAGFALSRRTKLRAPLMVMLVFTMMFSGGLIPSYMINMGLGLMENRWAVIIPGCINAFYIIMPPKCASGTKKAISIKISPAAPRICSSCQHVSHIRRRGGRVVRHDRQLGRQDVHARIRPCL